MLARAASDRAKRVEIARHGSNENLQARETRRIDGKEKMTHLARRRNIIVDHSHELVVERRALQNGGKHSCNPGEGGALKAEIGAAKREQHPNLIGVAGALAGRIGRDIVGKTETEGTVKEDAVKRYR